LATVLQIKHWATDRLLVANVQHPQVNLLRKVGRIGFATEAARGARFGNQNLPL
jgi:hypothetical protein